MTFIAPHYIKAKKRSFFSFFKQDRFLIKTPWWIKKLYPGCLWDMGKQEKVIYLTFDDGPHPSITPWLLQLLDTYNAKATFFCIGDNVVKYPDVYQQILAMGHAVGNHTQHHLNGWKTKDIDYLQDIRVAGMHIASPLFRPPYGKISRSQIKKLSASTLDNKAPTIVMWNILAGDWVQELSPEKCYQRLHKKIKGGEIIVFHDSEKAWERMSFALPKLLAAYSKQGFSFQAIKK
jgi:peptidoglycan/xylan/chitin deacetylase (PgdA/CDA1 family)